MTRADELEQLAESYGHGTETRNMLRQAAVELRVALNQVAGLRKALGFYADAANHQPVPVPTNVSEDGGEIARRALHVLFPE